MSAQKPPVLDGKQPIAQMYLVEALYKYITDSGKRVYIKARADFMDPFLKRYEENKTVVLNVSPEALATSIEFAKEGYLRFTGRFSGVSRFIEVPIEAVVSIYSDPAADPLHFGNMTFGEFSVQREETPSAAEEADSSKSNGNVTHVEFGKKR